MSFDVACSAEHAFRVWTDRIGTWRQDPDGRAVRRHEGGGRRVGGAAGEWRERNRAGCQTLLPHYLAAIQKQAVTGKEGSR